MEDEMVAKWSNLKITAEEDDIADLGASNSEADGSKIALSLVGKILTVLDGAPWNFDNQLLLLGDINGDEQPESIELKYFPFWVRLYNLPLDSRSNSDVKIIAEKVGVVLEVEDDELGWDKSRRVRIMVDTSKPLRRVQKIRNKKGEISSIQFKYERLSTFCFLCGILGHTEKDCPNIAEEDEPDEKQWGLWLRASPRKGRGKFKKEIDSIHSAPQRKLVFTHKPIALQSQATVLSNQKTDKEVELGEVNKIVDYASEWLKGAICSRVGGCEC
ncbi:uncharacterized protein LOC110703672 [Chenopodium quinoa]|uniref:uncharacterized protein LOC110703672 n=1 Tax=Chenopodium quinoa TaxID=63459 RepID=UPI000B777449|nr:uncharacterized protein LOC110703672 [Chenopodium quinoa]